MNVGIIGNNLTSLALAKALVNKNVKVTLFYKTQSKQFKTNRCIGITSKNLDFLDKRVLKIDKKFFSCVNEIGIYFENNIKKEALNFKKNNFSLINIIKIEKLFSILELKLKENKYFKKKKINKKNFYESIINDNKYNLIFNCEKNNDLVKKYFYQSFKKDYKSEAITFNLTHKKIRNNKAVQIFTKYGPLAFLPLSDVQTSVVFSMYLKKKKYSNKEILKIINSYNKNYLIFKTSSLEKARLNYFSSRKYRLGKILLFGDILHQIHPLAGQGFNMTLRDLEILLQIFQKKIELGLNLDETILEEFEKKAKHYNFIYSNSINFLQDFFRFDSQIKNKFSSKIFKLIGKNKYINNFFTKVADRGINLN